MAIPSYLTVTPTSGSGNGSVSISSKTKHTGRVARSSTLKGRMTNYPSVEEVTINVTESPKAEFVSFSSSTYSVTKTGSTLSVTGTSNSSKLTFSYPSNGIGIAAITSYKVGTATATSGTAISGDPGATAQYTFTLSLTCSTNTAVKARSTQIKVTANSSSVTATTTITQAAGDPYLWLNSSGTSTFSVTVPQTGTAQSVQVLSNDAWEFE